MTQQANPRPRTHKECVALCVPGLKQKAYGLGAGAHGLRLVVSPSGTGAWVQRLWFGRKSRDVGIGPIGYVTLAQAKRKAFENRAAKYLNRSLDMAPIPRRSPRKSDGPTFEELARDVIEEHRPSWRGKRTAEQWEHTLSKWVHPLIGDKPVVALTRADVLSVFEQDCDGSILWLAKRRTAEGVMNRLKKILSKAVARGHLPANPVDDALNPSSPDCDLEIP